MRIKNYVLRHLQAALNSLGKLSRAPWANFMTCLVIGIALALPTTLFVALKNAEIISGSFQQTMQLSVFLKKDATETETLAFADKLKTHTGIQSVRPVSPKDGLQELQEQAGFSDVVATLQENPLPWVIIVSPQNAYQTPQRINQIDQYLKQNPLVENVQIDMMWVKRLNMLISLFHRISYALAIFLGIAVLLLVNNTIRHITQQHHKEIEVIKLIGGTSAFIRRPFLYSGMLYGFLGGLIAWILVTLLILVLKSPADEMATLYASHFSLSGLGASNTLILLSAAVLLGWLGSWLAVTRHLRLS